MVILIQCKDQVGLVGAVANIFAAMNINIVAMREHVDTIDNRFFLRIVVDGSIDTIVAERQLKAVLPADAEVKISHQAEKKIVVLVTKEYHCLSDILVRNHFKTLGASVQCVIGNHAALEEICKRFDVPFYPVSTDNTDKPVFESSLLSIIKKWGADYLVLAKFMRILSADFVEQFAFQIINIHHSFLPAFIGASPYKQAYERGVKLIGATAHFVTNQLDEGPIIAQQIIPVTHSFTTADMVRSGKEIETAVLARALHLVFEDRVLIHKNKTIVFE
ncbi:MAG: formyltetrahydrofolate deformylase [Ferruginibacter sp.]|uniref:formyltetrahydrofolate deformylase n=1 Tax=Ferruginibacter sp. TaxID=1940288 RepID=UPI0026596705|nr:formyltetrahydrofolate deformylase [Ferruginibacter sp.]MDB5278955.1 formyltetrahydrofolate deformylase [Ferruginibacter sp.]